ncbi:MAG: sigma-70 family RNA polymerase sigma factor [Phycisphaerae bacterium]|nr:sigma-70 family RNA polymerase sigma factor [Phycisphaerae bacterium]
MTTLESERKITEAEQLANKYLPMVPRIAARLHRWYEWVARDDLESYAYLGLAMAAKKFQPERGVPFENFASRKAMYLAIDEMRKAGILKRRGAAPGPSIGMLNPEIPDPSGPKAFASLERRDMCESLLGKVSDSDRKLLMMYYADQMTFLEIGEVLGLSESGARLRHKGVMNRLRRMARLSPVA